MSAGGTRPARPFQQRRTATAADIDELGHVNNAVYVRWIQDIATAHWRAVAPASAQEDHIWVVVRHEIGNAFIPPRALLAPRASAPHSAHVA